MRGLELELRPEKKLHAYLKGIDYKITSYEDTTPPNEREQSPPSHALDFPVGVGAALQDNCNAKQATSCLGLVQNSSTDDLPRVKLPYLDRTPTEYWSFIKQFEYYTETKSFDPGQRMLQLLQYCKGQAKENIKDCVMLQPSVAYQRARQVLHNLFS